MDHAVFAGSKLHEGAHLGEDAHDRADEHIAHLRIACDGEDDRLGVLGVFGVLAVGGDADAAVVFDVDLDARLFDDLVDDLAAAADDLADLVGIDGEGDDLGRVFRQLCAGFGQHFEHLVEDELPALVRLGDGAAEDVFGNALDLDIHLDGGDALFGAGDLEVHVAQEVFEALDIGEDGDAVAVGVFNEAHGATRDGCLDGDARIHQRQRRAAHARLRGGAVGAENVRDHADGVRELVGAGHDGLEGALCKGAVADLAAAGALEALGLARGIAGEVILVHVALGDFVVQTVQLLHFGQSAQGTGGEHLRLAAGEHGGAVHAGQDARLAPDGADLFQRPAVGADALVQNFGADFFFGQVIQAVFDLARFIGIGVGKVGEDVFFHLVLLLFAGGAVVLFQSLIEHVGRIGAHGGVDIFGNVIQFHLALGFADLFLDLLDEGALLFDLFMAEEDGADHLFVGDLLRARFDHHDGVFGAGKAEVQAAALALGVIGVDDVFAVHKPDLYRTRGACPGDIGDAQGDGAAHHGEGFGRDVRIDGKRRGDDDDVVEQPLGEQRADGPVDEAGGEDPLVARPALALFEAAGDLAHGVHLLFEIDLQGEEVHPLARRFGHGDVDHDDGVAAADDAGAVCLLCILARFDDDFPAADLCFKLSVIHSTLLDSLFLRQIPDPPHIYHEGEQPFALTYSEIIFSNRDGQRYLCIFQCPSI